MTPLSDVAKSFKPSPNVVNVPLAPTEAAPDRVMVTVMVSLRSASDRVIPEKSFLVVLSLISWADVPEIVRASLTDVDVTMVVASVTAEAVPSLTEMVKVVFSVEAAVPRLSVGLKASFRMAIWAASVLPDAKL